MAGVDKALESLRSAVGILGGERIDPVVAPVALAGKLRDRHDLDRGDSKRYQIVQLLNGRIEGACRGECADVQFIEDVAVQGDAPPAVVRPGKSRVYDLRGAVNTLRLKARGRVRPFLAAVKAIQIESVRRNSFQHAAVVAMTVPPKHLQPLFRGQHAHRNRIRNGSPYAETAAPIAYRHGAELGRRICHEDPPCLKKTAPRGGSTRFSEWRNPCEGMGFASTPPRLPWPLPP